MKYQEPEMWILMMNQDDVVCQASPGNGIEDGGQLPEIGEDQGGYS